VDQREPGNCVPHSPGRLPTGLELVS